MKTLQENQEEDGDVENTQAVTFNFRILVTANCSRGLAANEHCFYNLYVCRKLEREGFDQLSPLI